MVSSYKTLLGLQVIIRPQYYWFPQLNSQYIFHFHLACIEEYHHHKQSELETLAG